MVLNLTAKLRLAFIRSDFALSGFPTDNFLRGDTLIAKRYNQLRRWS